MEIRLKSLFGVNGIRSISDMLAGGLNWNFISLSSFNLLQKFPPFGENLPQYPAEKSFHFPQRSFNHLNKQGGPKIKCPK